MKKDKNNVRIKESVTNLKNLNIIPADEVQLNLDVVYNSVLDEICSVVPMNSPKQIISYLSLCYGSKDKSVSDSIQNNKDVVDTYLMNGVGAMPLDDYGYTTNNVQFYPNALEFIGQYKNIIPGSIKIADLTDDGNGNLTDTANSIKGTVNYNTAVFKLNDSQYSDKLVSYKFNIYDIDTSRNFVYWEKKNTVVFADQFQLDMDSAVVLNGFKSLDLKSKTEKLLPEVLAQQIDSFMIQKIFDQLNLSSTKTYVHNISETSLSALKSHNIAIKDISTFITRDMSSFAKHTGVFPNVMLCDPYSYAIISLSDNFVPLTSEEITEISKVSCMPKKVGYFNSATVFLVNYNRNDENNATIILTYKGPSDAQAACVVTPYIPVSLVNKTGMEGSGMIDTYNAYSLDGFSITNPQLIEGIKIQQQ